MRSNFINLYLIILFLLTNIFFKCTENIFKEDDIFKNNNLSFLSFEPLRTQNAIINLISNAQNTIEVALYGLGDELISNELIIANNHRNVAVRMVSSLDQENTHGWKRIVEAGIPVRFGNRNGIMHNKYFIIDRKYLLTGSTNLTTGLFDHFNNTIILKSEDLVKDFLTDFEILFKGYFASSKDEGYFKLYSGGSKTENLWYSKRHKISNESDIRAYFTPYKKTIPEYSFNINDFPLCENTCIVPPKTDNEKCVNQECAQEACYLYKKNYNSTVYTFPNYDKNGELYCSEYDNAMNVVTKLVRNAKKSILVLAFAFRDKLFLNELIKAKNQRDVDVKIYIDNQQYKTGLSQSRDTFLEVAKQTNFLKICLKPDATLLHHKVVVVDHQTVILGSLNFSQNAVENNDENFVIIENNPSLAIAFYQEAANIDEYSHYLKITNEDRNNFKN